MSRFSGPQEKGAMRAHRARLRDQADTRNTQTAPERTAAFRRAADAAVEANTNSRGRRGRDAA